MSPESVRSRRAARSRDPEGAELCVEVKAFIRGPAVDPFESELFILSRFHTDDETLDSPTNPVRYGLAHTLLPSGKAGCAFRGLLICWPATAFHQSRE